MSTSGSGYGSGGVGGEGYGEAPRSVDILANVDEAVTRRRDRVRWSAVWAGLAVAVATYLLLQLLLIAVGLVELGNAETSDAVWSAIAALIAFFVGGVTAGASAFWRDSDDGLLHGIIMWAAGLVLLLFLAITGSGIALGSIDTTEVFDRFNADQVNVEQANDDAQEAAGKGVAGMVAALVAAAVGGAVGSKMWPRREEVTVGKVRSSTI